MRKIIFGFTLLGMISCKNTQESTAITPSRNLKDYLEIPMGTNNLLIGEIASPNDDVKLDYTIRKQNDTLMIIKDLIEADDLDGKELVLKQQDNNIKKISVKYNISYLFSGTGSEDKYLDFNYMYSSDVENGRIPSFETIKRRKEVIDHLKKNSSLISKLAYTNYINYYNHFSEEKLMTCCISDYNVHLKIKNTPASKIGTLNLNDLQAILSYKSLIIDITTRSNKKIVIVYSRNDEHKHPEEHMDMKNVEFYDLFNEGTNIEFTPKDLSKNDPTIISFKKKLQAYEAQHPLIEDFDPENLSRLINNETFFDLQYYTDSSWLQYFITKYKIEMSTLNPVMKEAIEQEDYKAVKILLDNGYIASFNELNTVTQTKAARSLKLEENKKEGIEYYDASYSKIDKIAPLLTNAHHSNTIHDADGYTNLRKERNSSSEVLQKIKTGEHIEVLDNTGDWFSVKTKDGKKGYVHKSRIKSK